MLDVHPPHETAHTWKDFWIHVATICVGLLIAISLEQTVEWLHHKSEIRETRKLLKEERVHNVFNFHYDVSSARRDRANLENDLRIFQYLQQHPGTPPEDLPGVPSWTGTFSTYQRASWDSAAQANILVLMPREEVDLSRVLYYRLSDIEANRAALSDAINKASAYQFIEPDPSKLTREQVDVEVLDIQDCLRIIYGRLAKLSNIAHGFDDFYPGPSQAELDSLRRDISTNPAKDFPVAYAFNRRDYERETALDKADQPFLLFTKGYSERGMTHIAEAYEQVHAKYPDFKPEETILDGWGYAYLYRKELPAAISILKLNVQLYPDSWSAYDSLGDAYAKDGKKKLAIENYQHALKLNPSAQSSIDALKELQK